ncbi:MAG TPA: T9SS type A sorting domain-containing protein [Bacteroidales bacterium]|nr:T9SS type A sorting domain-containing protein [Bacteroidales bacterium]
MKKLIFLISMFFCFSLFIKAQDFFSFDTVCLEDHIDMSFPIIVSGYGEDQIINTEDGAFLKICANVEHSYIGDLYLYIICPNGQQAIIHEYYSCNNAYFGEPNHSDNCNPGIGYDYCWAMNASFFLEDICFSGSTVPADTYLPSTSFNDLIGCPINGIWSLRVYDNWGADDGTLFNWSIDFFQQPNTGKYLTGNVFVDINENNVYDQEEDFAWSNMIIKAEPGPRYGISDNLGQYSILIVDTTEDNYTVRPLFDSEIWDLSYPEESFHTVSFESEDTISGLDFAYVADSYCPDLEVDINLMQNVVVLCNNTYAQIIYENHGTLFSENTTIKVELNDFYEYISGGDLISQEENMLTFDVGNVEIGESGSFYIVLNTTCDTEFLGATACVKAHIYPDDPCGEISTEWDRSSIAVEGECVGDSLICFTITNTGDPVEGDMQGYSDYRLYQNNVLMEYGTFQLEGGEILEMCWQATGMTLRLEADQRPGHPGNSHPQESIELCGSPNNSTGQISVVPSDDNDDFVEIDCSIIVASYDPNEKYVIPQGLFSEHFIDSTTMLEYKICFQNTGTAPAQKIIIDDIISEYLNIETFHFMSSSHPCNIDIVGLNTIRWTFENINLPDSTSNEPESHGYVKFKIEQQSGNQLFDVITNSAAIFFDYNSAVITNEVFNTIGKMDEVVTYKPDAFEDQKVKVFPNPAADYIMFSVDSDIYDVELYDLYGRIVMNIKGISSTEYKIPVNTISNGVYYYRIIDKSGIIGSGKVIVFDK